MKLRCVVSVGIVAAISLIAIAALAGSMQENPEKQITELEATVIGPEIIYEPRQHAIEALAKEPEETPYQSHIEGMEFTEEEYYLLAKIAMAEAEAEDTEGKALVMLVVLNRVLDDSFPDTIEQVIYQPKQFSPIENGRFDRVEPNDDCWAALELVMHDKWDESLGATYFESESKSTWHSNNLKFLFQHGSHYFYSEKEVCRD